MAGKNHARVARDVHFAVHALCQSDASMEHYDVQKTIHNLSMLRKGFSLKDKDTGFRYSVEIVER